MKTTKVSKQLIDMLNRALESEHQANMQYLSHAELVDGENAEAVIARLKEIASDEAEHATKFREMIGAYLGGTPSMKAAPAKAAKTVKEILTANLADEREAVELYGEIMELLRKERDNLPYAYMKLEHLLRHVIMDEMEHITELKNLLGEGPED
ncbi:ferritin-like domain-containing protein [Candidatus Woesearchaeota archaeon]|nr:ferritin-like domain-containing protein [Candidatus Woesearchaeota archaeon]